MSDRNSFKVVLKNTIKLLYFTHYENVGEDNVTFKDCNKLLSEIKKYELRK